jgi:hypothetical protein
MEPVDVRAARSARDQRGLITRRQLDERAGVAPSTVGARLRDGCWVERYPNVIDLGTHARTWRGDVLAVVLAAGDHAWASHATAAHLWGFLDAPRPDDVDVLVPRGRHAKVGQLRLRTTRGIGRDEVTQRHGVPCTTRARTLLDLAFGTDPDTLERYLADQVRRDRALLRRVIELADRHGTVRGRRKLLRVVGRLPDGASELGSPLEVLVVQRLRALGAPPFVLQYTVRDEDGVRIKRLDIVWPELRIAIEVDGAAYHDLTGAREEDERVRGHLRAIGWTVEVVRRADLDGPGLEQFVGRLRAR